MAVTDINVISHIGILEDGQIEVRRTRRVFDGTDILGEKHMRFVLEPGQDVSNQPLRLQRICNTVWTAQVIADYAAAKAANTQPLVH